MINLSLKGGSIPIILILAAKLTAPVSTRVDGWVRPECLKGEVHLIDCDFSNPDQIKCKRMAVDFRYDCVRMEVVHK